MRAAGVFAAMLALTASPCLAAQAQAPGPPGRIWAGTLGDQPITACFDERYDSDGHYYVNAQLEPIRLAQSDGTAPQVFTEIAGREDETGAVWTLQPATAGQMGGEWRKGDTALPIRLTAIPAAVPEYGSACETAAFLDPLLAGGTYTAGPATFDGTAYTRFEYQGPERMGLDDYTITSLALDPVRPGDAAINRALAAALPDGSAGHQMGQCVGLSLGSGIGGYAEELLAPILIAPRWISIRHSGTGYCGGAHPNHFSGFAVYDRDSGAEADPSSWFKPDALTFYDFEAELDPKPAKRPIAGVSDALAKALLARWPERGEDDECGVPELLGSSSWQIGLTREGPVLVPQLPHVIFACTEEVVLPWKAARPFLSDAGKAVRKSLR